MSTHVRWLTGSAVPLGLEKSPNTITALKRRAIFESSLRD
jgi:hypothetical protein